MVNGQAQAGGTRRIVDRGNELPQAGGHPFYVQVNRILDAADSTALSKSVAGGFMRTRWVGLRLPPTVYFRLLLIDTSRGSTASGALLATVGLLALRRFVGYALTDEPADHSTLSRTRRLIDVETHQEIFVWVYRSLPDTSFWTARPPVVDATRWSQCGAAEHRATGHEGELSGVSDAAGKASGSDSDARGLGADGQEPQEQGSNKDWEHPHDPVREDHQDEGCRTHLAHKAVARAWT